MLFRFHVFEIRLIAGVGETVLRKVRGRIVLNIVSVVVHKVDDVRHIERKAGLRVIGHDLETMHRHPVIVDEAGLHRIVLKDLIAVPDRALYDVLRVCRRDLRIAHLIIEIRGQR